MLNQTLQKADRKRANLEKQRSEIMAYWDAKNGRDFYESERWRAVRYEAMKRSRGLCEACGRGRRETPLHVDHIKPRSRYPELQLDLNNLQVLCRDCNVGKSNIDETDWRRIP